MGRGERFLDPCLWRDGTKARKKKEVGANIQVLRHNAIKEECNDKVDREQNGGRRDRYWSRKKSLLPGKACLQERGGVASYAEKKKWGANSREKKEKSRSAGKIKLSPGQPKKRPVMRTKAYNARFVVKKGQGSAVWVPGGGGKSKKKTRWGFPNRRWQSRQGPGVRKSLCREQNQRNQRKKKKQRLKKNLLKSPGGSKKFMPYDSSLLCGRGKNGGSSRGLEKFLGGLVKREGLRDPIKPGERKGKREKTRDPISGS